MSKAIAGINLGGYNMSVVEGVDLNGFHSHLIENALSQKLTKAVIEYKENIRHVGYNISTPGRRSRNVFTSPKSILGLNKDECVEDVKYFPSIQVVGAAEHPDVDIQEFRLNFLGNDKFVNSFQIYISFIKFLNEMIKNVGNEVTEYVISYPPYYNEKQLLSLKELLKELNVSKTTRLIPEYIASGLCYGYENNDRLKSNGVSEIITIIDMGYICSSCSIFKYENDEMKLCLNKNEKLGGRDIDKVLMEYIYDKMKIVCGDLKDLYEDFSLYKKIEKSIINCKEKLSADGADEIMLSVESFYEDEDFETTLTVDDLNKLLKANGFDERLKNLVYETIKESGLNEEEVKKLEIVIIGGSMRIPLFKTKLLELLEETNGKDKLIQTLNMDENDAYGCCYYGGIKTEKWKYKIENFKEKTLFESDERIREIINESLEKDKEMEEEDNKTKRNSSYRNELEGIKFQLKSKVNVIEEDDESLYRKCMNEIERILKYKDNSFEDHYKQFAEEYDEKLIYKYLKTYTSLHVEDISNINIHPLYCKIMEMYEGWKIEIEKVETLKEEYSKNPQLNSQQIINLKQLSEVYAIANSGFENNYHEKELLELKEKYENVFNSLSQMVEIECDSFTEFKEWLYNYCNRKVIMVNEEVELKEDEIKKEIKHLKVVIPLYKEINSLINDIMKYLPLYYPQHQIAEYYSKNIGKIKYENKNTNSEVHENEDPESKIIKILTEIHTKLNDMIKDDKDFYKSKYMIIKEEIDYLVDIDELATHCQPTTTVLSKTYSNKDILLYQKLLIKDLDAVSLDELKSKSADYEQYLSIMKEREKKNNDKNTLIELLENMAKLYPHMKDTVQADIKQLKDIIGYKLDRDEYDETKKKYQKKYEIGLTNYKTYQKLNDIFILLQELNEFGDRYNEYYKEYRNNNANNISNTMLLDKLDKLYEEMIDKKNYYEEFNVLVDKLCYIRHTTIKCDILKRKASELYTVIETNNIDKVKNNKEIVSKAKKIVKFYECLSSMRNIKREFAEVYFCLKKILPIEEYYEEKYNEIINYINVINDEELKVDESYYERIKKYNEEIKIADRVYFMKNGIMKLLDAYGEIEERKEIEDINPVDNTNSIISINKIIYKLHHKYNISYEDINNSIQNIIKDNTEYIELYNKYCVKEVLSKVVEYIKYSDILPIINNINQFIVDDRNNFIKDYIEAYHILRRMHFNYKDLHNELHNIVESKFEDKRIADKCVFKQYFNDESIPIGKYLEILDDIKRIEQSLIIIQPPPPHPPPPQQQQQYQQQQYQQQMDLTQPEQFVPLPLENSLPQQLDFPILQPQSSDLQPLLPLPSENSQQSSLPQLEPKQQFIKTSNKFINIKNKMENDSKSVQYTHSDILPEQSSTYFNLSRSVPINNSKADNEIEKNYDKQKDEIEDKTEVIPLKKYKKPNLLIIQNKKDNLVIPQDEIEQVNSKR